MTPALMPPLIDPYVKDFLVNSRDLIHCLADAHGSPLNIVFPQYLYRNAQAYKDTLTHLGIQSSAIYFAAKANKSSAFIESAAASNIGIDASSLYEIRAALSHGILGQHISVSGPSKSLPTLLLALRHGCIIVVDSIPELELLLATLKRIFVAQQTRITIRVNGLSQHQSRFGVDVGDLDRAMALIQHHSSIACLHGLAFHLSGYSVEERAQALKALVCIVVDARRRGHQCPWINIGGGYTVNYVDEAAWVNFQSQGNCAFPDNKLPTSLYPYNSRNSGPDFLRAILLSSGENAGSLADDLSRHKIGLAIEPGRSLVAQAGITLMAIKGIKTRLDGGALLEVEGNINSLSEQWFDSEFCVDPIVVNRITINPNPQQACIVGNTCLEIDLISRRAVCFDCTPSPGDLLAFVNTAGYQMDSNESSFHRLPIPQKLAVYRAGNSWRWKEDAQFNILDMYNGDS